MSGYHTQCLRITFYITDYVSQLKEKLVLTDSEKKLIHKKEWKFL